MKKPDRYIINGVIKYTLVVLGVLALSYLLTALVFYGICECLGLDIWSYGASFGVWLVLFAISSIRIVVGDRHV